MNALLRCSLFLNAILLTGMIWSSCQSSQDQSSPVRIIRRPLSAPELPTPPLPDIQPATPTRPSFRWSDIESADYRVYRDNLRRIHCPERIIRDILVADLDALFALKRNALVQPHQDRFWTLLLGQDLETFIDEKMRQLNSLQEEKEQALEALLGPGWEMALCNETHDATQERLGFLPEDQQTQVLNLRDRYLARMEQIEIDPNLTDDEKRSRIDALRRQEREELSRLLSPEQFREFDMHLSLAAQRLRDLLAAFQPSENEFRQFHEIQQKVDALFAKAPSSEQSDQAKEEMFEREVQNMMDSERYAEYQRARDPGYQDLHALGSRMGLDESVIAATHQIRKSFENQIRQINDNLAMPDDERQRDLQALRREAEQRLLQTLGAAAYREYREQHSLP